MELDKHNQDHDRLDQWLDRALRQYADATPRPGLERVILANLESVKAARRGREWTWAWACGAAAVAACVALGFWIGGTQHRANQTIVSLRPAPAANAQGPISTSAAVKSSTAATRDFRKHGRGLELDIPRAPRLEVFPSSQPLSEQEQMLVSYVQRFPQEALLIAQRQARDEEEMQRAMEGPREEYGPGSSNVNER